LPPEAERRRRPDLLWVLFGFLHGVPYAPSTTGKSATVRLSISGFAAFLLLSDLCVELLWIVDR
jgi:hypothetical protein